MTNSEIRTLLNKLSKEDNEEVINAIWFLQEDCISAIDYINNALKLSELISKLKEKYEYNRRNN